MDTARLSLRIDLPDGTRFGPGKAALLFALSETGSIRGAAQQLNMSYPRALKLIDQMNASFRSPLVATKQGGADGGGAQVTSTGQGILRLYEKICAQARHTNADAFEELDGYLVK